MDWMRPFNPDTLVKTAYGANDANEVELDYEENSDVHSDEDSNSNGDEPICLPTRSWTKTLESQSDNDTNDIDNRSDVTIDEPSD